MTDAEFARDPFVAMHRELTLVEAAALRAERHLLRPDVRVEDARASVVTVLELLRNMMTILRRATL